MHVWLSHTGSVRLSISSRMTRWLRGEFSVLLMLYAINVGVKFEGDRGARILESLAAFLVGATSLAGWLYAVRAGLVSSGFPGDEVKALSEKSLAEPLTAVITIPFAFIGPVFWEVSWLFYPLIRRVLKKRTAMRNSEG